MESRDGACETGVGVREVSHNTPCAPVGIREVRHGRFKLIVGHFLIDLLGMPPNPNWPAFIVVFFLELDFRLPEGLEVIPSF